jgi:hypothetical protein
MDEEEYMVSEESMVELCLDYRDMFSEEEVEFLKEFKTKLETNQVISSGSSFKLKAMWDCI